MSEDTGKSKKVPKLRFPGFTDDWEQRRLGDEAIEIVAGGDIDKLKLVEIGKYPVIANSLADGGIIGYYEEDYRIKAPAVTVTGRGDVGHAQARKVNFTPVVRLLSVTTKHNVDFLSEAINRNEVVLESTGVPQLTVPKLSNYQIFFPSILNEEKKIGQFFELLDRHITFQQRKLDHLKERKKALLQKMFPKEGTNVPELRFPGFTDAWEQRRLGEFVRRISEYSEDEGLPRINYEDIVSGEGRLNKDVFNRQDNRRGIHFKKDNILYGKLRPYLQNWILASFEGVAVGDFWGLDVLKENPKFVYYLIQTEVFGKITNETTGTKMPRADWGKVSNTSFFLPINDEQQQIGQFFELLDHHITVQQRKLDHLKLRKKALLQQMFV